MTKTVHINGDSHRTEAATIAALLAELELEPARLAVEHNRVIAPRSQLDERPLADGDTLEIVHFVGGG